MRTADFDYHLPLELIAQRPLERRDQSRLLVLARESGQIHTLVHAGGTASARMRSSTVALRMFFPSAPA